MRTIGKVVVALAVAAFFGVAATSAFSEQTVWQNCVKVEGGRFENNQCSGLKENGGWEAQEQKTIS
jgi:hypothetical protein